MFGFLRGASEPATVQHHVFGTLTLKKKFGSRWWTGTVDRAPLGREVSLAICTKGGNDAPTHLHEEFLDELSRRYDQLLPEIAKSISEAAAEAGKVVPPDRAMDNLTLSLVYIPFLANGDTPLGWHLEFSAAGESCCTVTMNDWDVGFAADYTA